MILWKCTLKNVKNVLELFCFKLLELSFFPNCFVIPVRRSYFAMCLRRTFRRFPNGTVFLDNLLNRQLPKLERCIQCEMNREADILDYRTSHQIFKRLYSGWNPGSAVRISFEASLLMEETTGWRLFLCAGMWCKHEHIVYRWDWPFKKPVDPEDLFVKDLFLKDQFCTILSCVQMNVQD